MSFGQSSTFPNYGSTTAHTEIRPRTMSETAYRDIGTRLDSVALRDNIHIYRKTANELVPITTRFVTDLQKMVQKNASKEQRFQANRLENEFCETVRRYDILQKQLVPKMKQTILPVEQSHRNSFGDHESDNLINIEQQEQLIVQADLEHEFGLLQDRDNRIRQIEEDILDVNETFKALATRVHEQGEMIGTIEENITHTAHQVEDGTQQLSKASEYQKKYRNKLCCLMLILLFISGIITIIIVVETR